MGQVSYINKLLNDYFDKILLANFVDFVWIRFF